MELGRLKHNASWFTVGFVFGCIFVITFLLYFAVKAEEKAQELSYQTGDFSHYLQD